MTGNNRRIVNSNAAAMRAARMRCRLCSRQFTNGQAMADHMAAKHGSGSKRPANILGPEEVYINDTNKLSPIGRGPLMVSNRMRDIVMQSLAGLDSEGQKFSLRYLHPMDEVLTGGIRIPDSRSEPTCALEGRSTMTINSPSAEGNWNCDIIVLPLGDMSFAYRTYITTAEPPTQWNVVTYTAFPPGRASISTPESPSTVQRIPSLAEYTDQFRTCFSGITCHLNAAAVNNAGIVYAGQYGAVTNLQSISNSGGFTGTAWNFDVPNTENDLYMKCPGSTQWEARHGVYMPLMFVNPVNLFTDSPTQNAFIGSVPQGAASVNGGAYLKAGVEYATLFSGISNMTTGVIMFRGLYSAASIQVKTRLGLEAVPSDKSPWQPFMETSPPLNQRAMDSIALVRQRLQMAYPAHYNDLSSILKAIASVLTGPVKGLSSSVRGLPIPVVSEVAGFLDDVIR